MTISQLLLALAFGGFGNSFFRRVKSNLRMGAVAKRLFRGCTTTTKRHPFFNGERISIRVLEFNRSSNNVRAVLNRLDSYVSHDGCNLSEKYVSRPLHRNSVLLPGESYLKVRHGSLDWRSE